MEPKFHGKRTKDAKDIKDVYNTCQITSHVKIPFTGLGKLFHQTIEHTISKKYEGKCIVEGYVKPGSVQIISHSSGVLKGSDVLFDIVYNCKVCFPVAGMKFECIAENITKAGIRAESADEKPTPFVVLISRDHFYDNEEFASIKKGDKIMVRVIAQRFELNDKFISIIAELVPRDRKSIVSKKAMIVMED